MLFLLGNGVFIVFCITMILLMLIDLKKLSKDQVKTKIKKSYPVLITTSIITLVTSILVFGQLFNLYALECVAIAMLIVNPIYRKLK